MKVATWNLDGWAPMRAADKAQLVTDTGVELLCAQELTEPRFIQMLAALGADWWGMHSLEVFPGHSSRTQWGVAVFGRKSLGEPDRGGAEVIGSIADDSGAGLFWRRTLLVPVQTQLGRLSVISVHVRPGSVVKRQKLQFLSNLHEWIDRVPDPVVLGVDANSPGNDAGRDHFWEDDQGGVDELGMWGSRPLHRLIDCWGVGKSTPTFTHKIKRRSTHAEVRFDHVLVSPRTTVQTCQHYYDEAVTAGSDHALVVADILIGAAPG